MGGYESKNKAGHGFEKEEEEDDEEDTSDGETRRLVAHFSDIRRAWFFGQWRGVAKAVNASKAARRQLEELQRHNRAMEGYGLHLAPYKHGSGVTRRTKKKSWKKTLRSLELSLSGITTNEQLSRSARRLRVPFFRGVFMRNALLSKARRNEHREFRRLDGYSLGRLREEGQRRGLLRRFWQSSTAEGTREISRRRRKYNVQSRIVSDVRSEHLRSVVPAISFEDRSRCR
ncbi:hypothetical protein P5V15_009255 [Pogonomyrmex californicus]